jgi:glucose/mannose-6-phosphate isomerase
LLDNLKVIHEKDPQDALGVIEKQWQQLQYDFGVQFTPSASIQNVVLAGMGGSALPGVFLASWPGLKVPFEIVRNYNLPEYVGKNTLVISSSYSGNTEEALSALAEAEEKGAQIVVIAADGKLLQQAKEKKYPLFQIPGGVQPRMTSFYFLAAFVQLLEPVDLLPKGSLKELQAVGDWLKKEVENWRPDVPTIKNAAKKLAQELMGKSVIVYSGPKLFPAANKFKICLNENAKNLAWVNQYPELNHNEFIGWSSHPTQKPFAVVEIRSNLEHERIQKRFEVTERLLSGMRPAPHVVKPEGKTLIQQLLWTCVHDDFTSIYLALLNGVNPTPVDLVEKFKLALG